MPRQSRSRIRSAAAGLNWLDGSTAAPAHLTSVGGVYFLKAEDRSEIAIPPRPILGPPLRHFRRGTGAAEIVVLRRSMRAVRKAGPIFRYRRSISF